MKLYFVTPTQVDLRELFTLGLGSKRGDDTKIGHKGSGMKFTLALLHRLGSSLEVRVDGRTWTSKTCDITIRDKQHAVIKLVWSESDPNLPEDERGYEERDTNITLNAGSDTWTEPWFAVRELYQNVLDEGGFTTAWVTDAIAPHGTVMSIDLTPPLAEAWQNIGEWYHPRHPEVIYDVAKPGKGGLFFHGFRIYTAEKWKRCYDVTTILGRDNLSEDRQARNVSHTELFNKIVLKAKLSIDVYDDVVNGEEIEDVQLLIEAVYYHIARDEPKFGGFDLADLENAFIRKHGTRAAICSEANDRAIYFASGAGYTLVVLPYRLMFILGYSKQIKKLSELMPSLPGRLQDVAARSVDRNAVARLKRAAAITKSLRPEGCEIRMVEPKMKGDDIGAVALADRASNRVLLVRSWAENASVQELVEALIEEYVHISSDTSDGTVEFEKALIRIIATKLTPKPRSQFAIV